MTWRYPIIFSNHLEACLSYKMGEWMRSFDLDHAVLPLRRCCPPALLAVELICSVKLTTALMALHCFLSNESLGPTATHLWFIGFSLLALSLLSPKLGFTYKSRRDEFWFRSTTPTSILAYDIPLPQRQLQRVVITRTRIVLHVFFYICSKSFYRKYVSGLAP